jgi:hypothetical protein
MGRELGQHQPHVAGDGVLEFPVLGGVDLGDAGADDRYRAAAVLQGSAVLVTESVPEPKI